MDLNSLFNGIENIQIKMKADLSDYSTMRLMAVGNVVIVKKLESLQKMLQRHPSLEYRVLGLGSNQILSTDFKGFFLKLELPFDKSTLNEFSQEYSLPASLPLGQLTAHAIKYGIKGWEVFTGIPATLGGAIWMNAGTELGEIGPLVKEVEIINRKGVLQTLTLNSKEGYFSYRKNLFGQEGDIITRAVLVNFGKDDNISKIIRGYLEKRSKTQPLDRLTCGCVFKNYSNICRAGKFLDILNLKGLEYKGMRISPVHANFIENIGRASAKEFNELVKIINDEVELHFGIKFDLEVKI